MNALLLISIIYINTKCVSMTTTYGSQLSMRWKNKVWRDLQPHFLCLLEYNRNTLYSVKQYIH